MPVFAATAGLLVAFAFAITLFGQSQVVLHLFVGGILVLCRGERRVRALVVTTQHIREALIVENLDGRSNNADRLTVGAVREIKPAQAIVGGGKADPGLGIARMRLDGAAEMLFGKTIMLLVRFQPGGCAGLLKNPRKYGANAHREQRLGNHQD